LERNDYGLSLFLFRIKPKINLSHSLHAEVKGASDFYLSWAIFHAQLMAEPMGCWQVGSNPAFTWLVAMADDETSREIAADQAAIPMDSHNR
jgi:hypothetical protein